MLRNYQFIMIAIFVTSPALVLPAHTHQQNCKHSSCGGKNIQCEERERERKRERGMGSAVIAVLVCVLLDFMNPAQALGGWLGWTGRLLRDVFTPAMIT